MNISLEKCKKYLKRINVQSFYDMKKGPMQGKENTLQSLGEF